MIPICLLLRELEEPERSFFRRETIREEASRLTRRPLGHSANCLT